MRSKPAHLPMGMLLLAVCAFVSWRLAQGWLSTWKQQDPASQRADDPSFDPTTGDPVIAEAAKLHLYGVLSNLPAARKAQDNTSQGNGAPRGGSAIAPGGVNASPAVPPRRLLHRQFFVRDYRQFQFVVPAHAVHPRLQGTYEAVGSSGAAGNDSANVDVLLLTDDEFKDFLRGNNDASRFTTNPAQRGEINWLLNATFAVPQKYHLVFHNSGVNGSERVDAEFTVSF